MTSCKEHLELDANIVLTLQEQQKNWIRNELLPAAVPAARGTKGTNYGDAGVHQVGFKWSNQLFTV